MKLPYSFFYFWAKSIQYPHLILLPNRVIYKKIVNFCGNTNTVSKIERLLKYLYSFISFTNDFCRHSYLPFAFTFPLARFKGNKYVSLGIFGTAPYVQLFFRAMFSISVSNLRQHTCIYTGERLPPRLANNHRLVDSSSRRYERSASKRG